MEHVLALVAQLSPVERKELLARLALAEQQTGPGKANRDLDMWATAVYEAITTAFGGLDGAGQGPLVVKRVLAVSANWAPVAEFMEVSGLAKATVTERQVIYRMLADLVVGRARQVAAHTKAPLSTKFVAQTAQNIRGIFDAEFPGYLAAGLAPKVIQRLRAISQE